MRRRGAATQQKKETQLIEVAREAKIRYAVVGLGYIAQIAVLPAFATAKNSEVAALVSDDRVRLEKLSKK